MALKAIHPAVTLATPPLAPSPDPIKATPMTHGAPHTSPRPTPLLPVLSSLYCAPAGELWCTGATGSQAPVSAPPRPGPALCPHHCRSMVDRACSAGPRTRGPSPQLYPLKNKSPAEIPRHFAKKPLYFFEINPRSRFADFALRPLCFSKINPQSMILQLGPEI
jgi:hypothetical protein